MQTPFKYVCPMHHLNTRYYHSSDGGYISYSNLIIHVNVLFVEGSHHFLEVWKEEWSEITYQLMQKLRRTPNQKLLLPPYLILGQLWADGHNIVINVASLCSNLKGVIIAIYIRGNTGTMLEAVLLWSLPTQSSHLVQCRVIFVLISI